MSKIHVEKLMEDAEYWWRYETEERGDIILKEYMKAKGIKEEDVDW